MRVLITGAAGFIGSHLADRLIKAAHEVVGVDNFLTGNRDNFPSGSELYEIDICDRPELYALANTLEPELVVHCAASYSDPNLWHRDTDTNVAGTINATLVAKHHGARLIYFQTALPPISSYAISKIAGEQYIRLSGVDCLIFRLANIYGPRNLSGPIPTFYKRLQAGDGCTVVDTSREMVYIDDLIQGVMTGIGVGRISGKFDMCTGSSYQISELYDAVTQALGITVRAEHVRASSDDVTSMELDPEPALRILGWKPATPLAVGVTRAVAWYREHGVGETFTHLTLKG